MNNLRYASVFLVVALATGFAYWWQQDWWADVELSNGPVPKFELPWWVQLPVSSLVGGFWGCLAVLALAAVKRFWPRPSSSTPA